MADARRYIRHPSELPVEIRRASVEGADSPRMTDLGCGGLAFHWCHALQPGTHLHLRLPCLDPPMDLPDAHVAWCRPERAGYAIGVRFADPGAAFLVRMVEQVIHIERYRRRLARRGRTVTSEVAAAEWIARHAPGFPDP